jgi:hypothetical protein
MTKRSLLLYYQKLAHFEKLMRKKPPCVESFADGKTLEPFPVEDVQDPRTDNAETDDQ